MLIETIPVGILQCNCSVVACDVSREAIIIDPGDEPDRILGIVRARDLQVRYVLHTHAHIDHIMGAYDVANATGAEARIHCGDLPAWHRMPAAARAYGISNLKLPRLGPPLGDGDTLQFGNAELRVRHTPGHTAGSCSFTMDISNGNSVAFAGDTLFRGKLGVDSRRDRRGHLPTIVSSIRNQLLVLDDNTRVIAGHGAETTIGAERKNPLFDRQPT
jgi:hydroxyacylglutathione hydrolase